MKPGRRPVYLAAVVFYVALFAALVWPIYPRFATIEPRIFAMPFSLAYVVAALLVSFGVLLALFLWEGAEADEMPELDDAERFHPRGGKG